MIVVVGLAFLLLAETSFPPIPSEASLSRAGFFVGRDELLGFVSALVGVTGADLDLAEGCFDGNGPWAGLVARIMPLARSVVSIPAEVLKMPLWEGRSGNKELQSIILRPR